MAYPEDPLPVVVKMRLGDLGWVNITDRVFVRDGGISIQDGFPDEATQPIPSSALMSLDNRDGRFTVRHPTGPYYGLIGRNVPVTVEFATILAKRGGRLGADTSQDAPSVDLDTKAGLLVCVWGSIFTTGTSDYTVPLGMAAAPEVDGINSTSIAGYETLDEMGPTGAHSAAISDAPDLWVSASVTIPGAHVVVEETVQGYASTGNDLTLTTSTNVRAGDLLLLIDAFVTAAAPEGWTEIAAGIWIRTASAGVNSVTLADASSGKHCHLFVLSGVDRLHHLIQPPTSIQYCGEASELPTRWDPSEQDVWTSLTAQGPLRRLTQGKRPSRSPLTSAILSKNERESIFSQNTLVAYWPMEGGAGTFLSALPGGAPMTCTGSAPAAGEQGVGPLLGSDRIPVLESDTRLSGPVAAAPDGPYCVFAVVDFPPTITWPDGASVMRVRQAPGGTVATWEARYRTANGGELEFRSLDTAGSVIETSTGNASISGVAQAMLVFFLDADFAVHYLQVYYVDDGGQIQFNFSGSIGALGDATHAVEIQVAPLGGLTDLGIGQVGASTDVTFAHSLALGVDHSALLAFEGERAAARAARLTVDAGVAFTLIGDADDSEQMGPQDVPDTLGNALDETWRADAALLHDSRTELGLTFRTRASLYDQDIALTLDYQGAGELAPYLEPVDDDQLTRNDIEVKRKGGGARARAVDRDSRLGVADPPDGIGTYDEQVEVNVYTDEQIEHHAYWRLRVRTWDEVRYPRVELNMAAMAQAGKWDLISAICSLRVGDRIRLTNLPIWAGSSTVDLLYLGRSMRLGHPVEWEITLNCVPYGPYEVKRLGDNPPDVDALTGRLVGDDRCALRAAISETDTTIDFDSNFYRWTTLWLHDTASRTDGSGWGAPDIGPQWVDDASGGTASVAGGDLIHAMTMTDDYVSSVVDGLIVADVQVYLRGVHPASTPSGGSISGVVYLRTNMAGTNVHAGVTFAADGTATAFGDGSSVPRTSATIPGVTASESVDVLIQLVGPRLKVWAAPSSVGIDLEHAPLVSIAVAAMTANMLTVDTETDSGLSVPLAMHYGAVEITSPGSFVDDFPLPVMLMRSPAAKTSGGELISATRITTTEAAFVAAGTPAHDDNTAVVPVDYSGGAVGDWVMVVAAERDSTVELSISDGNYEYTLLCQHGGLYVWAAIRTADIPAPTITPSGGGSGDTVSAVMFGLRNMPVTLAPGQYVLDQAMRTNSSAQNIAYPGLPEGIYWGRVILLVARKSDDWTGVAPPTGFTEAVDSSTTSGDEQGIAVYYRIDESPSVVNPGSLAVTGGSSAASDVLVLALAGGYQTMTVDRAHNGIKKAHAAGTYLEVRDELVVAL